MPNTFDNATHRQLLTYADLTADPRWRHKVTIRWSDPNDSGENVADIAKETLGLLTADPDTVAQIQALVDLVLSRPPLAKLQAAGVVEIRMSDVQPGLRGRVGWGFIVEDYLVLVVLYSAFENDIPGEHLDNGRNAFTEIQLGLIRSRRDGVAHYAFGTRLGRTRRNRLDLTTAMQRYGWTLYLGGVQRDFHDPILEGVEGGYAEKNSRDFFAATGKGELDDLAAGLYPRNEYGLPFTHRFARVKATVGGVKYVGVKAKEVEVNPDAVAQMQALTPMVAANATWEAIGEKAGELGIRARGGKDAKHHTGRTIADLKWKAHAIRDHFRGNYKLFTTGKTTLRWHGKVQGGQTYGTHGTPTHYTLEELRAMTPRQRKKAEKGYFEITVTWGAPMLADPTGELTPWGVSWATWALVKARLDEEEEKARPTGAAAQMRDKKPLVGVNGPHTWVEGRHRYAIVTSRADLYELHRRDAKVTGGWKKSPGETIAVWRSGDFHEAVGATLRDALAELADQTLPLEVRATAGGSMVETRRTRLREQAKQARAHAQELTTRAAGIDALAQKLAGKGMVDQALEQLEAKPGLLAEANQARADANRLDAQADQVAEEKEHAATADFATPVAVAAGLLAYPGKAPWQFAEACGVLLHEHRAVLVNEGQSVRWSMRMHLREASGNIGVHTLTGVVPNRLRRTTTAITVDSYERAARAYFTAPTAVTFDELASQFGWEPAEVRRKAAVWLGHRAGVPAGLDLPVRIPQAGLRAARLDCPIVEVRHAVWATLVPAEAHIAAYLSIPYRRHIAATHLNPDLVWPGQWAADTHITRRRLMDLCMAAPVVSAGVTFSAAAAHVAVAEKVIAEFSRPYQVNARTNRAPAYPPSFDRVTPFGRRTGRVPADLKRIRPRRCPHPDCEGRRNGRTDGWCTVILRVPELATTALLCPDCRRAPDRAMAHIRFPISYLTPWVGPRG